MGSPIEFRRLEECVCVYYCIQTLFVCLLNLFTSLGFASLSHFLSSSYTLSVGFSQSPHRLCCSLFLDHYIHATSRASFLHALFSVFIFSVFRHILRGMQ